ncbi:uncharacterized protein LOC131664957 [Phymastichus coffea]|uniref:uncharacterized protein LOC131664957 n=1 Tax=Phymastichus coffea TaxID=108790 RepID=UPI00273B188E|nr:uncharacterized protein LOC131664957 [Phymastichus coffea]
MCGEAVRRRGGESAGRSRFEWAARETRVGSFGPLLAGERMRREGLLPLLLLLLLARARAAEPGCRAGNVSLPRATRAADAGYKYLVFPQGSNVQLIYCLTIGSFARPQSVFTLGVTAGLAYELPYRRTLPHRKPAEVYHRRNRRDLYRKLEAMLDAQGRPGRDCVLRALCRAGERSRRRAPRRGTFLEEILRAVFTFPSLEHAREENGHHAELMRHYERAYDARDDCDQRFGAESCPWLL